MRNNTHQQILASSFLFLLPVILVNTFFSQLIPVFQVLVEIFSVVIGLAIFTLVWTNEKHTSNNLVIMAGTGLLFAALIELMHILVFMGFETFGLNSAGTELIFSVTGRMLLSIFFLLALIYKDKNWDKKHILFSFFLISSVVVFSAVSLFGHSQPDSNQLSMVKLISGYTVIFINLTAIYLINRRIDNKYEELRTYIIYFLSCIIISAYFFSLFNYEQYNLNVLGFAFKALAFYLLYRAFIKFSYLDPFTRLNTEKVRLLEEYRFLFNSVSDGLVLHYVDEEGNSSDFLMVNDSFCRMSGYSRNQLIKMGPLDFFDESEKAAAKEMLASIIKKNKSVFETVLTMAGGHRVFTEIYSNIFVRDEKICVISSIRDISTRIKMEKERLERERFIEQQTKMVLLGEMIGAIAHQWKQPLTSIALIIQCLDEVECKDSKSETKLKNSINKVMDNILFLSSTIDEFRNFIKPKAGGRSFHVLKSMIETVRIFGPQFKKDNITIDLYCKLFGENPEIKDADTNQNIIIHGSHVGFDCIHCTNQDAFVNGSENEFKNAVLNLISNSRDAISAAKKQDGHIVITMDRKGSNLIAEISDNGGGVPEEIMDKIFNQFFTTKAEKGTGIGLYMVKNIVESNLKGSITCKNSQNGAVFTLVLPAAVTVPGSEKA